MERKKTSLLIIGLCAFILSVVGITYAFWMLTLSQTDENNIASSCFEVTLTKEGTGIHLDKAYPILDSDGEALEPYTFTITNTCEAYAGYQINLESLSKSDGATIPDSDRLKPDYLKVKINEVGTEGIISILKDNDVVTKTLDDAYESHKLMTGYLGPSKSKDFEFRLWLDGALTMEDVDAMNKTFVSKITVTASYLEEEKVPPTVDLELALCENTITATGTATPSGDKSIEKYEFKIDNAEKWEDNSGNNTKQFTVEASEKHTVGMKVTDSNGITSEVTKEIQQETVNIYGRDIPVTSCGDGLYEVEHNDLNSVSEEGGILASDLEGWKKAEYRYAGTNVNNYVWFNCGPDASSGETCEKWRIIGLVNVKTTNGIEQRIKIIRDESIGDYSWDYKPSGKGSSTSSNGSNDWTDSQLMEMLNDGYYNSSSNVSCYKGNSSSTTCDFTSTGLKGTEEELTKKMIDKEIIWNLGGTEIYATSSNGLVTHWYGYERGTTVQSGRPTEWQASNTGRASSETTSGKKLDSSLFRGVALPYPSDYGYATSGSNSGKTRDECINDTFLYSYNSDSGCYEKDWLKPESGYMWTLSPNSSTSNRVFYVDSEGYVDNSYYRVFGSNGVWPALYLSSKVSISDATGDSEYPLGSEQNPFTLIMEG